MATQRHEGRRRRAGPGPTVVRHRRHRRGRLNDVLAAGAHRVVVVRAITEAADPHAAARLAERLGPP